jgi:hypothetical protein
MIETFKLAERKGSYTPKSTREEYGSTEEPSSDCKRGQIFLVYMVHIGNIKF